MAMRTEAPEADALVTDTPGLAVGITTADCLPILLADGKTASSPPPMPDGKARSAASSKRRWPPCKSWERKLPSIAATIGPAIAQGSYEVGAEFYDRFLAEDENNHQYFIHGGRPGHFLFDLKAAAKDRLRDAGLSQINVLAHDTCFEENDFFSYRRATLRKEPVYGCQISAIVSAKE